MASGILTPPLKIRLLPDGHLWYHEVTCQCWKNSQGPFCNGGMVDHRLVQKFEEIRTSISFYTFQDTPITVSSGYRCPRWNSLQPGSSSTSYHLKGLALDLHTPRGIILQQFVDLVFSRHREDGGILIYDWGVHMDLGPKRLVDMRK